MKNITIFLALILVSCIFGYIAYTNVFSSWDTDTLSSNVEELNTEDVEVIDMSDQSMKDISENEKQEIVNKKIENLKRRLALKWLIVEGDSYFNSHQLPLALKKYLDFYAKNPSDPLIVEKIGNTYFAMKKFSSAQKYYTKIPTPNASITQWIITSSLYTTDINNQTEVGDFLQLLDTLELSQEEKFYYTTSTSCVQDFSACQQAFRSYFWPEEDIEIVGDPLSGSWWVDIVFPPLKNIQTAIENYENFQQEDPFLQDAYIIAEFYKDGLYPLAISLWESLLTHTPNYKPIIKIIAQSEFEMGNYSKAKNILSEYQEIDKNDTDVLYMIAVINELKREYLIANIYLNEALKNGHSNVIDIYRRQAHNYAVLGDETNMLQSFKNLVAQNEIQAGDLALAIYYHILHQEYKQAEIWAKQGQWKFQEEGNFYAYEGWIQRENEQFEESLVTLKKWLSIDPTNPFIIINLGYTQHALKNKWAAIVYFKEVIQKYPKSEFAEQAQKALDTL